MVALVVVLCFRVLRVRRTITASTPGGLTAPTGFQLCVGVIIWFFSIVWLTVEISTLKDVSLPIPIGSAKIHRVEIMSDTVSSTLPRPKAARPRPRPSNSRACACVRRRGVRRRETRMRNDPKTPSGGESIGRRRANSDPTLPLSSCVRTPSDATSSRPTWHLVLRQAWRA